MLLKIVSIYDGKAEAWMNPLVFQSNGQAIRSFGDAVNDSSSELGKHPEDYDLFELGEFDQLTGDIKKLKAPAHLAKGLNLVAAQTIADVRKAFTVENGDVV